VCKVLISYDIERPAAPQVDMPHSSCDRAGMELATAQVLAQMLGAPPPPYPKGR
jgi:hypothetical protein